MSFLKISFSEKKLVVFNVVFVVLNSFKTDFTVYNFGNPKVTSLQPKIGSHWSGMMQKTWRETCS